MIDMPTAPRRQIAYDYRMQTSRYGLAFGARPISHFCPSDNSRAIDVASPCASPATGLSSSGKPKPFAHPTTSSRFPASHSTIPRTSISDDQVAQALGPKLGMH